jgi:hypothetical protein
VASLTDLYAAPATRPPGLALADLNDEQTNLTVDAGVAKSRSIRDFTTFDLPDLVSSFAARGTGGSGALQRAAGRARMSVEEGIGDIDNQVARNLASIARQRTLATLGVQ